MIPKRNLGNSKGRYADAISPLSVDTKYNGAQFLSCVKGYGRARALRHAGLSMLVQGMPVPDMEIVASTVEKIPPITPPNAEPSPDVGLTPILPYSKSRIVRKDIPEPIEPDPFALVKRRSMARPSPLSLGVFMIPSNRKKIPSVYRSPRPLQCPIPSCRKKLAGSRELYSHWESHHMGMNDTAMSETHVAEGAFNSS